VSNATETPDIAVDAATTNGDPDADSLDRTVGASQQQQQQQQSPTKTVENESNADESEVLGKKLRFLLELNWKLKHRAHCHSWVPALRAVDQLASYFAATGESLLEASADIAAFAQHGGADEIVAASEATAAAPIADKGFFSSLKKSINGNNNKTAVDGGLTIVRVTPAARAANRAAGASAATMLSALHSFAVKASGRFSVPAAQLSPLDLIERWEDRVATILSDLVEIAATYDLHDALIAHAVSTSSSPAGDAERALTEDELTEQKLALVSFDSAEGAGASLQLLVVMMPPSANPSTATRSDLGVGPTATEYAAVWAAVLTSLRRMSAVSKFVMRALQAADSHLRV
jgi:hypothetical protein